MKKLMLTVCLILGLLIAPMAWADQVSIGSLFGPYQTGGGGEFTLRPDAQLSWILNAGYVDGVTMNVPGFPGTFQTFCVETREAIYRNTIYDVTISDHSIYTNVTLTKGAAYLYHQFQIGQLQGYDYTRNPNNGANETQQLQDAIWYLMGSVSVDPNNQFSALGMANGGFALNNNYYPVAVLNLWAVGHLNEYGYRYQDVLVCVNVPEPGILILLGIAMTAIGIASRYVRKI